MRSWRWVGILNALCLVLLLARGTPAQAEGPGPQGRTADQPPLSPARNGELHLLYGNEDLPIRVLEKADGECYVDLSEPALARFFTLHGMSVRWSEGSPRTATIYAEGHYVHWAVGARRGLVDGAEVTWAAPVIIACNDEGAVSLRALAQLLGFRLRPQAGADGSWRFVARIEKLHLDNTADREVRVRATGPLEDARIETSGQTTTITLPRAEWGMDTRSYDFGDVTVRGSGSGAEGDPVTLSVTVPVQWKTESVGRLVPNLLAVRIVPDFAVLPNQVTVNLGQPRHFKGIGDLYVMIDASASVQKLWRFDGDQHLLTIDVPNAAIESGATSVDGDVTRIETEVLRTATFPYARIRIHLREGYGFEVSSTDPTRIAVRVAPMALLPVTTTYGGDLGPCGRGGGLIVIDPGHGGGDSGAVNRSLGLLEKDITLDISLRLKTALEHRGFRVVMTREDDRDVSWVKSPDAVELGARVSVANSRGADLFVSIHCNSAVSPGHNGTELHWYKDTDLPVARALEGALANGAGFTDKGLIRNRFFVLRRTSMPAVLVETAYLSNYEDAVRLSDAAVRQRIADTLADALTVKFPASRREDVSTRRPSP